MEKSVTTLQMILFFDVAKLFFSNLITNQDSKALNTFHQKENLLLCLLKTRDFGDELLSILIEGLYE